MWQTISYVSTANASLTNSDMDELFEFVRINNNNLNITGILMYSDGNFFQVLEGEKDQVDSLFKKIQQDSRHHNVIKIFDREITSCSFSEYHSSFKVLGKNYDHGELQHFLKEEKFHNPENFKNIFYLANKFLKLS
ncbi:BLUF domain-containing protein [Aquimarina sp. 2201CG14-23]|uniref:BLUF domain-containing protein n=1 Tax=Aquimarina mycalae TaxID=3040073 RepID=UPI0024781638|nr:BLUF domain-containing protein [Aquimarina sp. 2201CG14-23]MDH7445129.1 BLUF domain-containing protein [Aquimarina sp. 2201CG14-23]